MARQRIALVDPDLPVTEVKTMDDFLESLTTQRRFTLLLFGIFSGLAFLLATVGLYGIVAYWVARRTEELEIRMALGAARGRYSAARSLGRPDVDRRRHSRWRHRFARFESPPVDVAL